MTHKNKKEGKKEKERERELVRMEGERGKSDIFKLLYKKKEH